MSEKKTQNQDDFFNEENEAKANWMKFEKIGDSVKGILVGISDKPAQGMFAAQKVYELKIEDDIMLVGLNIKKQFVHSRMKNAKIGQIVGFRYESDYQTEENKKKGLNPSKTIKVYLGGMDKNYQQIQPADDEIDVSQIPL